MSVWFTRSNGFTLHNNPADRRFVAGEMPRFPETQFDYRETCLAEGFARIGWPAAGDLNDADWQVRGSAAYSEEEFGQLHHGYLEQFRSIRTGDLILIPAGGSEYVTHLGRVVLRDRSTRELLCLRPRLPAYYYHHDVGRQCWYENAHRVDVTWDRDQAGKAAEHLVPTLGGIWRHAFAPVRTAEDEVLKIARSVGLLA